MADKMILTKLRKHRLLIFNSADPAIAPALAKHGVDKAYIDEGKALYHEAETLVNDKKEEYKKQGTAYNVFYATKDGVEEQHKSTVRLITTYSRKDAALQKRLGLEKPRRHDIQGGIQDALDFYHNLLAETDFLEVLKKRKITIATLTAQQQAFETLKSLHDTASAQKGPAQNATEYRNQKLEALDDYCEELKVIASEALKEKPQLLEKLGVFVRS